MAQRNHRKVNKQTIQNKKKLKGREGGKKSGDVPAKADYSGMKYGG